MLGIYRTAGDRYGWWIESMSGFVTHVTAVFVLLVSVLSFGCLFATWDIDWFRHFWQRRRRSVSVLKHKKGLGASPEAKVHYSKEG